MEESINFKDLLSIIFRKAKMIIIIMLVFGALAGAAKLVPTLKNSVSSADKTELNLQYQKDLDKYNIEKSSIDKQIEKNKVDIIKFIIIAITTLIIAGMLILTPATMDIRNVSESKSEVVTDVSDR